MQGIKTAIIIFLSFCWFSAYSQTAAPCHQAESGQSEETKPGLVHSLWVTTGFDYVAHSLDDEIRDKFPPEDMIKINSSLPVSLRYSFSFLNPKIPHYLPGGYQGVSVGVLNLGVAQRNGLKTSSRNIGYPILAYIFQGGPFHKFNDRLSLNYEWNFGAAIGWKPYSEQNKYLNLVVGSKVNAYLNLGLSLNWQLNDHTSVFGGVSVSHFSNGNTSFPNPGINTFGLRVGMVWTLNPPPEDYAPVLPDTVKRRKMEYDIMAWGASRKRLFRGIDPPVLLPGHYACAGISFAPMVRLNRWWRVGGSLDLQWDQSSDMKRNYIDGTTTDDIRFTQPSFWRQSTVGISAHGELQMPIFAVNIGCGYNILAPWENRGSYQNIALKTYICEKVFINIGYQLRNFHQQSSLMLGAGVTL